MNFRKSQETSGGLQEVSNTLQGVSGTFPRDPRGSRSISGGLRGISEGRSGIQGYSGNFRKSSGFQGISEIILALHTIVNPRNPIALKRQRYLSERP